MALADLTSNEAVLEALAEFERIGEEAFLQKYGFSQSYDYVIRHELNDYPAEAILGAAYGGQFPDAGPLSHTTLSEGQPTIDKLGGLGFVVERRAETPRPPAVFVVRGGSRGEGEELCLREGICGSGGG